MAKLLKTLLVLGLLAPAPVYAAKAPNTYTKRLRGDQGTFKILDGVALNATEGARTIDVDIQAAWSKVVVFVDFSRTAATDIIATPTYSPDGVVYFSYTSRSITSGASTVSPLVDTYPTAADASFALEYDVRTAKKLKIIFSGTSAGGSDLVDVYISVVAGD